MARKLPWSAEAVTESSKPQTKRAASTVSKSERQETNSRPITPEPTPQASRKRFKARSPSTSPIQAPPQPIQTIEPMRPGLHADDRYILVEDEFESLARQFTAHLHAAEYARLKRIARSAPPKPVPDISPSMPRATKLSLERRQLLSRQNTGMSEITKRAKAAAAQLEDGDSDGDSDDEQDGRGKDLWSGTSLAGLMGENTQIKTSLIGLQRMDSGTRAAGGFGRGEASMREERRSISDIFRKGQLGDDEVQDEDEAPFERPKKGKERAQTYTDLEHASSKELVRDKTAKIVKSPLSSRKRTLPAEDDHQTSRKSVNYTVKADEELDDIPKPRLQPSTRLNPSKAKPRRTFLDDMDDFDKIGSKATIGSTSPAKKKVATTASRAGKVDPKKDRKSRLDEVPVFLV